MSTIYKKTLKGVEETSLRSQGLQLKFRQYLKLVDGVKSVEQIQSENPSLPNIDAMLAVLQSEGYIEALH